MGADNLSRREMRNKSSCVRLCDHLRDFDVSSSGQRSINLVVTHDGISRACMKKSFIPSPGKRHGKQLNIALFKPWSFPVFLSFSLNLPFRRHRWLPFNSSFHQRIFQARSSCKEPRIMSSNRRVSMPVNAVRRSPRRRTKTPSVNELSRKCSK